MNIEEIKKKLRDYNADVVTSRGCNDPVDFSLDVAFLVVENERLLSITEEDKKKIKYLQLLPDTEKILDILNFFEKVTSMDINHIGELRNNFEWMQNETKRFLHEVNRF